MKWGENMILVDVRIPAVDATYDFMLDENTPVEQIKMEIIEMVAKQTQSGKPENTEEFMLFSTKEKRQLQGNRTLYEAGIKDGHSLMLV